MEEHSRGSGEIRELIVHLDGRVDALSVRIDGLDRKVDRFREELGSRIDALDQKVDRFRAELSSRIDALDQRLTGRVDALDLKLDAFRQDVSRQFNWLVGIQVAILLSIIGALLRT